MIALYYDQLNKWGKYDDFFMEILEVIQAEKIADLGCGTGRVTLEMSKAGYNVTAIDPNAEAIQIAQNKPGSESVTWIVGDSKDLSNNMFDVVIMTANVAQVFITDISWETVIKDAYTALKPGGHFIFDTRNPHSKVWEEWLKDDTVEEIIDAHTGDTLLYWDEYEGLHNNIFTFHQKIKNETTNMFHESKVQLIFRSEEDISKSLKQVGFTNVNIYEDGTFKTATPQAKSYIFDCVK